MNANNKKLRGIIRTNQMTHLTVSKLLDVSVSTVNKWSCGGRNMPTASIKYLTMLIKAQGMKK